MASDRPELSPLLVRALTSFPTRIEFARAIGERRMTIWDWENKVGYIPAQYAIVVEKVTGIDARAIVEEAHRRKGLGQWTADEA